MKREQLTEIFARVARAEGYAFGSGELQNLNGEMRTYPAAWLVPPTVTGKTGRQEGSITWRTTMYLIALDGGGVAGSEHVWQALEADALGIAAGVAAHGAVCSVEKVSCTPSRQSLTVHGETSVQLVCEVTMWYYI